MADLARASAAAAQRELTVRAVIVAITGEALVLLVLAVLSQLAPHLLGGAG